MNLSYCFYLLLLYSIFLIRTGVASDPTIQAEQQAEAFFAARDDKKTSAIYLKLLSLNPPSWQKERLLYNLGIVQLASYNSDEALKQFYSIDLKSSSYPLLVQYVITAQGLAYLQKALTSSQIEAKELLLDNSLQLFKSSKMITCQRQEMEEKAKSCIYPPELIEGIKLAQVQLFQLEQQERLELFSFDQLQLQFLILENSLKQIQPLITLLMSSDFPSSLNEKYSTFIQVRVADMILLWKALEEQPLSTVQKSSIDVAYENYLNAMQQIQQQNWSHVQEKLQVAQHALEEVEIKTKLLYEILIDQALLLNEHFYSLASIENIQKKLAELISSNNSELSWKQAQSYMNLALREMKKEHLMQTEFFLWASFYQLKNSAETLSTQNTPKEVLKLALNNAKASLKLNFLSQKIDDENTKITSIVKKFQDNTVREADNFLKVVKMQEVDHFQKLGQETSDQRCQHYPWEKTIPLFEKGYQIAISVQNRLEHSSQMHSTLDKQVKTIFYWQQALESMNQTQKNPQESEQQQTQHPQDIQDVFVELQEMELDDTPKKKTANKELQAW